MILNFGGSFFLNNNIRNENGLDYLIEAVAAKVFGIELYPGLFLKAAFYMNSINSNHIFYDGNKRTGLASSLLFLEKNNFHLKVDIQFRDITDFAIGVAAGEYDLNQIENWLNGNSEQTI